jgi:hypothetical protein
VRFAREFHNLSRNIKLINFGSVDFVQFNFELGTSIQIWFKQINEIQTGGLQRETKRASEREREKAGPVVRLAHAGRLTEGPTRQWLLTHRIGMREEGRWIRSQINGRGSSSSPTRPNPTGGEARGSAA